MYNYLIWMFSPFKYTYFDEFEVNLYVTCVNCIIKKLFDNLKNCFEKMNIKFLILLLYERQINV